MTKATAVLFACVPHVSISIVDGFFKEPLYGYAHEAFWAFDILKFVILTIVIVVWLARSYSITPPSYGLRKENAEYWFNCIVLVVALTLLLNFVYTIVRLIALKFLGVVPTPAFSYQLTIPKGLLHYPVLVYFGLTAGFAEEIFFRALPLLYIKERFGNVKPGWKYVVATSFLFAAAHWENGPHEIIATFAFGVVASLLYLKLRDLWPLVGAHALIDIWNFS